MYSAVGKPPFRLRIWVLSVCLMAAGCGDESEKRPSSAAFQLKSFERRACAEQTPEFKCFEALIANVGDRDGQGMCILRSRRGSEAQYAQGGITRELALSRGESVKLLIVVTAGDKGHFFTPSVACNPGIGG
jgi:hypothetical protein